MELPSQQISMLPFWLQRTAERAQSQGPVADHISVRRETCHVETQDGFKVLKCSEIREVFRCAADGQREIVEKTESTHVKPYEQPCFESSSGRYDGVMEGPMGPAVSATLGQMLDDFFQYAAELQQSLEQQDAYTGGGSSSSWLQLGRGVSSSSSSSTDDTADSSSRLFSWWQRRKAAAAASNPGAGQPSLQQLVRESSSGQHVQEL